MHLKGRIVVFESEPAAVTSGCVCLELRVLQVAFDELWDLRRHVKVRWSGESRSHMFYACLPDSIDSLGLADFDTRSSEYDLVFVRKLKESPARFHLVSSYPTGWTLGG